jgi:hypothetical protein
MGKQYTVEEMRKLPGTIRDDSDAPPMPRCKNGHTGHIVLVGIGYICNKKLRAFSNEEVSQGVCNGCC